jgi:hypothetical protein
MATLAGNSIASSYTSLLKLDGNTDSTAAGNGNNAIQVKTGDDDATPLFLNTDRLGIGGHPDTLLHLSATDSAKIRIESTDTTATASQVVGGLEFEGNDSSANANGIRANITATYEDIAGKTKLTFGTADSNASVSDRLTIDGDGNATFNNAVTVKNYIAIYDNDGSTLAGYVGSGQDMAFGDANDLCIRGVDSIKFTANDGNADAMTIDSSGNVGIGTATMESAGGGVSRLQVEGTTHETSSVSITRNANSANAGYLTFSKSRGTSVNSDTIVQDDDAIGSILFAPADGTDRNSISASIQGAIDGTPGSNDVPGRLVFSTTADGANSVTERMIIDSEGTVDHKGNYIVNEQGRQNHVANTMSSPYYRFDGSDDYIQILADGRTAFDTQKFSIEGLVKIDSMSNSDYFNIWSFDFTSHGSPFYAQHLRVNHLSGTTSINFAWNASGASNQEINVADKFILGKWNHLLATFENGSQKVYLNGVEVGSSTRTDTITYYNQEVWIGKNNFDFSNFELQKVRFFNKALTATEVKELYSGASVAYKYKGANQTSLVTGDDSTFASATGFWTLLGGSGTISITSNVLRFASTQSGYGAKRASLVTVGKAYRATFTISNYSAGSIKVYGNGVYSDLAVSSNGTHSLDFIAGSANTDFWINAIGTTTLDLDDFTLVPIGAVAEYDGSGIASDKWFDKSGNDLHGTITAGATAPTVENAPSGDDGLVYEEGTWNPTFTVSSGSGSITVDDSNNTCWYKRVGSIVHVGGRIGVSAISSPTGQVSITNLPYVISAGVESSALSTGSLILYSSASDTTGIVGLECSPTLAGFLLREGGGLASGVVGIADHFDTGTLVGFQVSYDTTT